MRITLTQDIVIRAGAELIAPPTASTRWGKDYEVIVGIDDDHTGYFSMDLDEAREAGIIREDDDFQAPPIAEGPQLGLATTRELMEELRARGIIGQSLIDDQDEDTLDYRTVNS